MGLLYICPIWAISLSTQAQTWQAPSSENTVKNKPNLPPNCRELTPQEAQIVMQQGGDPRAVFIDTNLAAQQLQTASKQSDLPPTPSDLKNAIVCLDNFMGMTNAMLAADVISMKTEALKFRINRQDYNYSGHYAVTLNNPRPHKNPYFGLGSPETAKIVVLENWNGNMLPLPNATIWEKSSGFIDAVSIGKEWIYSGTYTIQN